VASCVCGDGSSYSINLGNSVTGEVTVEFVKTVPQVRRRKFSWLLVAACMVDHNHTLQWIYKG